MQIILCPQCDKVLVSVEHITDLNNIVLDCIDCGAKYKIVEDSNDSE